MPKKQQERSYTIVNEISDIMTEIGSNMLSQAFPEQQEQLENINKLGVQLYKTTTKDSPLIQDDAEELQAYNEQTKSYSLSRNPYQLGGGAAFHDLNKPYQYDLRFAKPETYEKLHDQIRQYTNAVNDLLDSPQGKELEQKSPAVYSFLQNNINMLENYAEGRDVQNELNAVPGGAWFVGNAADFDEHTAEQNQELGEDDEIEIGEGFAGAEHEDKPGQRSLEGYEEALNTMHYQQIAENITRQRDLVNISQLPTVPENVKRNIEIEQTELIGKLQTEAEHLTSAQTTEAISDFHKDPDLCVTGAFGVQQFRNAVNNQAEALDRGWPAEYAQDYAAIKESTKLCRENAKTLEQLSRQGLNGLGTLSRKMQAVGEMSPEGKVFRTPAEFVTYMQNYSDALNDMLEESRKPEVQKQIIPAQQQQRTAENNAENKRAEADRLRSSIWELSNIKNMDPDGKGVPSIAEMNQVIAEKKGLIAEYEAMKPDLKAKIQAQEREIKACQELVNRETKKYEEEKKAYNKELKRLGLKPDQDIHKSDKRFNDRESARESLQAAENKLTEAKDKLAAAEQTQRRNRGDLQQANNYISTNREIISDVEKAKQQHAKYTQALEEAKRAEANIPQVGDSLVEKLHIDGSRRATGDPMRRNLEHFAKRANFRAQGITAANGILSFDEDAAEKMKPKYAAVAEQAERIAPELAAAQDELAQLPKKFDELGEPNLRMQNMANLLKTGSTLGDGNASYTDIEHHLMSISAQASDYLEENTVLPEKETRSATQSSNAAA